MKLINKTLKIKHCSHVKGSIVQISMKQNHYDAPLLKIQTCRALSLENLQRESTCQNLKLFLKTISAADIMGHSTTAYSTCGFDEVFEDNQEKSCI